MLFVGKNGKLSQAFNSCDSIQNTGEAVDTTTAKWVGWTYDKTTSQVRFYVNGIFQETRSASGAAPGCPSPNLQMGNPVVFAWDTSAR